MLKANGWGNIGSANITKRKVEVALMDGGSLISPTFCFLNKITGWLNGSTLWLGQLWSFPSRLKPVPRHPTLQLLIKVIKWLPKTPEEKTWPQPWLYIPQVLTKTPHWSIQDSFEVRPPAAQAWRPKFDPQVPCTGGRREPSSQRCSPTSTHILWHVPTHIHITHTHY